MTEIANEIKNRGSQFSIEWYNVRYIKCPVCLEYSVKFFHLSEKPIRAWVQEHFLKCGATSYEESGYVEVVENDEWKKNGE